MTRKELIQELKKYFKIKELVCNHCAANYSEDQCWSFFSKNALEMLLVLRRDIIQKGFIINTSSATQRGLRCNLCQIPNDKTKKNKIYMSGHCTGEAFDITVDGMSAQQARDLIAKNESKLPCPIRLEEGVSWLHVDAYDMGNGRIINYFKV